MKLNDITYRLEPADWLLIGYLFGIFVWWLSEEVNPSPPRRPCPQTREEPEVGAPYQNVSLHEEALRRLENGEAVSMDRWHGNELVLRGDLVIDLEEEETE